MVFLKSHQTQAPLSTSCCSEVLNKLRKARTHKKPTDIFSSENSLCRKQSSSAVEMMAPPPGPPVGFSRSVPLGVNQPQVPQASEDSILQGCRGGWPRASQVPGSLQLRPRIWVPALSQPLPGHVALASSLGLADQRTHYGGQGTWIK